LPDLLARSYTATVRGLAYARNHRGTAGTAAPLVIAAPDVPGFDPLPGAAEEAAALVTILPGTVVLPDPARDTVLARLPGHPIAHFACHGDVNWADPAASRLILPGHETAPLTVADIGALRLTGGLAYLSACHTATVPPQLADEGIHITGAFHLAGYQHVVGTLWEINDIAAWQLARTFYSRLRDGTAPPDIDIGRSAEALHHAVRRLRARYPDQPGLWAAHTHTGI